MRLLKAVSSAEATELLEKGAPTQQLLPRKLKRSVDSIVYAKRTRPWSNSYVFAEQRVISQAQTPSGTRFILGPLQKTEFSVLVPLLAKPCVDKLKACAQCRNAVPMQQDDGTTKYVCVNYVTRPPKPWCYIQ